MKREFKKPQNQTELTLRFCEPDFFVFRKAFSGFQADSLHRFARNTQNSFREKSCFSVRPFSPSSWSE